MKALESLKKAGKIRFAGISTHSKEHDVIRAAIESKFYDVVLAAYNFRKTTSSSSIRPSPKRAKPGSASSP